MIFVTRISSQYPILRTNITGTILVIILFLRIAPFVRSYKNIFNFFLFQMSQHREFHSRWTDESWGNRANRRELYAIPRFKLSANF